jgi:hypothetical protein
MEGYDEATYGERMADAYDDWYGDLGDLAGCVDALASLAHASRDDGSRPIAVELGIGTGRIALPLAARGIDVRGVDTSAAMVSRLAAKANAGSIPVAIGDMAATDPPARPGDRDPLRPDLVFVAYNTLFNLPTDDAQQRCYGRVASWLGRAGRFVVEAFVPDVGESTSVVTVRTLEADRVVISAARVDEVDQTMSGQYVDITEAGIKLRPWHLHYQRPEQLDAMAAAAGLVLDERWSTWTGHHFDETSPHHISIYRTS